MTRLTITLNETSYAAFRAKALEQGTTMSRIIGEMIESFNDDGGLNDTCR